ncbi:hypothetical protein LIER_06859 [Lithospermum erythrorhizon]|uniref:GRF-type domain-containing protein n=1 Tax=Lithospermum erythrorhizon TaxID=34254 RepID=A0AAV3P9T5_LITER
MAPQISDMKCRCGRNAMEWVSFTQKNPGRRFVRCTNRVTPCCFWKWTDDSVSPLIRSAMDMNMMEAEKKVKVLGIAMVVCLVVIYVLFRDGQCEECKCTYNFGMYEIGAPQI